MLRGRAGKRDEVLEALRAAVRESGECPPLRRLGERVALKTTCVYQHLRGLERHGLVVRCRRGGYTAFWPKSEPTYAELRREYERLRVTI